MLGVRQWRHVAPRHGAFCVSRQHRLCPLMTSALPCIIHEEAYSSSIFMISESRAISHANDTEQQAQHGGWKSSSAKIFGRNSAGERPLKFIASGEDNKKPRSFKAEWRQRRQNSDHKHVQRQRQNTTTTLQMKPMKRGNTDCRRFKKRWGDQATLAFYSKIIFFDATIGNNSYTICTMHVKNIFSMDWGQPMSLYTMSNNGFYSKRYFTMNSL